MNTFGTADAATVFPGRLALTSFQFSSAGSFVKLSGSLPAGVHGPFTSVAFSHVSLFRKYNVLVGPYWNRSQLVLTAYFRSFSLIGLQIGSPSRFMITAGDLLKKIAGGSALMPSTFFETIWLLSMFARTRSSAITFSSSGTALSMASLIARTCSFGSVWKLASVTLMAVRLTS